MFSSSNHGWCLLSLLLMGEIGYIPFSWGKCLMKLFLYVLKLLLTWIKSCYYMNVFSFLGSLRRKHGNWHSSRHNAMQDGGGKVSKVAYESKSHWLVVILERHGFMIGGSIQQNCVVLPLRNNCPFFVVIYLFICFGSFLSFV